MLVPFVAPGETVHVETVKESRGLIRGRLEEVVAPAPERTEPRCEYFGQCGGCHYQHLNYDSQLEWKRTILAEVLRRVGKIDAPDIAVIAGPPFEYRNRVQLRVERERLGFLQPGTRVLQPVLGCPVAAPLINQTIPVLRRMAHQPRFPKFVQSIELFTNGEQVQVNVQVAGKRLARSFFDWCAKMIPGYAPGEIDYPAAGERYRVSGRSFFQVNRYLLDRLVEAALEGVAGGRALDLFAGVGLFSLPLARRFDAVTAVESGRSAAEDLVFNADRAGLSVQVRQEDAAEYLASIETGSAPDFVIADPPRSGLGAKVVSELNRLRPARLTIVACDPATLARDLAGLLAGDYEIDSMALIDLFPQTFHIESIVRLRAKPDSASSPGRAASESVSPGPLAAGG